MYFPIGWPKVLNIPKCKESVGEYKFKSIVCNRDKVIFAIISTNTISIWFCNPCVPITSHTRDVQSLQDFGHNTLVQWKSDSSMLVVTTNLGYLIFYKLEVDNTLRCLYEQIDSPQPNLCRENVELFTKETVPSLHLSVITQVAVPGSIPAIVCIRDELMVTSNNGQVWRYRWDGQINRDYCLDLRRIPFCMDQQVSKAVPIVEANTYIIDIEYSPLVGGFAVVFNDGRAAFLTASSLKFDPNQVQGLWAPNVDDATCATLNHKYRLITFGRQTGEGIVYVIDEHTGGLLNSHTLVVSDKVYTGELGAVCCMRYTPDGCALALAWSNGGFSLWSTFGSLLMCTLSWDYGIHADLSKRNPLYIKCIEWSAEGYQLWMLKTDVNKIVDRIDDSTKQDKPSDGTEDEIIQYGFVKSALTVNPTMSHQSHLYLQGEDKLYVNFGSGLSKLYQMNTNQDSYMDPTERTSSTISSTLIENKQWHVISLPATYSSTNWPIRYTAIDSEGKSLAVAGKCGFAHYSLMSRKWKLFGNETQEKDMVVTGGLLWYACSWIVLGCYSIPNDTDEIRFYPKDARLSNESMIHVIVSGQVLLLENLRHRVLTFCSDGRIYIYNVEESGTTVHVSHIQSIDISALCVHPACIVSITLSSLRHEPYKKDVHHPRDSFVMNVSGRLLLVHQYDDNKSQVVAAPTVLASCVETVWIPSSVKNKSKPHLTEALWFFCGCYGMRVWLPLFPKHNDKSAHHSFISKRIMLPFQLNIYPLAILFEEAILLGIENDTVLYTSSEPSSVFSLPFCILKRTSQVYIHQILRQLIRRNLGYHAWEIARCCTNLPYFPHSLELLLHEVLEEEATSKEPIPDAQLPSVIEFIQEFPVYLQTIVQCARKTEIALWNYLFAAAGKPKDLFQQCLQKNQLETASSYLIILQNLEPSLVSRQYATLLLDATLDQCKWELGKDLVRFLKAIDPNDIESPRTSFINNYKFGMQVSPLTPPLTSNEEDLSMVLGTMQVSRGRSYSTTTNPKLELHQMLSRNQSTHQILQTTTQQQQNRQSISEIKNDTIRRRKRSQNSNKSDNNNDNSNNEYDSNNTAEDFYMDIILQRHARRLLTLHQLKNLGYFAAHLDFHLVEWLLKEKIRAARIDSFIIALKNLHNQFNWPYPNLNGGNNVSVIAGGVGSHSINSGGVNRKISSTSMTSSLRSSPVSPVTLMASPMTNDLSLKYGNNGFGHSSSMAGNAFNINTNGSGICDSGYMSQEPVLQPHSGMMRIADERSILSEDTTTQSVFWNNSHSPWGAWHHEGDSSPTNVESPNLETWSDIPSTHVLDQLSNQINNRGSNKAEVQLRYLLQLFMEAGCLEWSFVISVLLKDAMAIHRITNAARSHEQNYESIYRLRDGFISLCKWSNTECLGYKTFMIAIQAQITILDKLLQEKQPKKSSPQSSVSTTPLPRSRTSSSNCDITNDTIDEANLTMDSNDNNILHSNNDPNISSIDNTEPNSCAIS